jgi:outer membrane protein OmpA-like peptidoglycan-associated protein
MPPVNDPKDPKNLPPDDFSKTTPFIRPPREDYSSRSSSSSSSSAPPSSSRDDYASDWEKTNFNYSIPKTTPTSAPPPVAGAPDDWGKTAANINLPHNKPAAAADDFGKTFIPGQTMPPVAPPPPNYHQPRSSGGHQESSGSGWDMTQANINVPGGFEDFGGSPRGGSSSGAHDYHATTPFIQLPEAERAKYQNTGGQQSSAASSSSSSNAAANSAAGYASHAAAHAEEKRDAKKAGAPAWVWYAGVAGFFLFTAAVMIGAWWFLTKSYGYDVIVKGAAPNSDIYVDNVRWNLTAKDGSYLLTGLGRGPHKIEIKHPQFTYEIEQVNGEDGDKPKEIVAKGRPVAAQNPPPTDECANATFKKGQFAEAAALANRCLDKLGDNFTPKQLLDAMNLYIINFDVNKYDIKPNDLKFLEKASGYMKKLPPDTKIEVGGHTDSDGPDDKNQILSDNRAKAVRDAFVNQFSVKPDMLETRGYGESKPKPGNTNANPDEKFQNRRIEYSLIIR